MERAAMMIMGHRLVFFKMYFAFFILFYSNYNSIVNIGCRYVTGRLVTTKIDPNDARNIVWATGECFFYLFHVF